MNLALSSKVACAISKQVESGRFATPEDVIAAAVLSFELQERYGDVGPGQLDPLLAEGERSIEREGTLEGDEAYRLRCERRVRCRE